MALQRLDGTGGSQARMAAYLALRRAILTGALPPGHRLVERELAAQLGISRTPVREALQKLEQEQLVARAGRRGLVVAGYSVDDVLETYDIRMALEGLATALAAERRTEEHLAELAALLNAMGTCLAGGEVTRYRQFHARFNEALFRCAGRPRLAQLLRSLEEQVAGLTDIAYRVPGRLEEAHREHEAIVAAIRARNPEAAEAAARHHLRRSRDVVLQVIRTGREGGTRL